VAVVRRKQAQIRADAAERRARVLQMRIAGVSQERIGKELGVSRQMAARLEKEALQQIVRPAAEELRALELERLDMLITTTLGVLRRRHYAVQGGEVVKRTNPETGVEEELVDDGPTLTAVATLERLSESRRRLLGLNAPARTRHEVITVDQLDAEIAELEAEMTRRDRADEPQPG
jgi:transcriptional regulator with XRE-family HTH domain